ncbi:MAG TPA: hypothetical protein VMG12_36650 [Polyangiaceae bacterium]|nr:hypothetical protein [Polyangiaceae bacterium]
MSFWACTPLDLREALELLAAQLLELGTFVPSRALAAEPLELSPLALCLSCVDAGWRSGAAYWLDQSAGADEDPSLCGR